MKRRKEHLISLLLVNFKLRDLFGLSTEQIYAFSMGEYSSKFAKVGGGCIIGISGQSESNKVFMGNKKVDRNLLF